MKPIEVVSHTDLTALKEKWRKAKNANDFKEVLELVVEYTPKFIREIEDGRSALCWGVSCVHQAKALDFVEEHEKEMDELRDKVREYKPYRDIYFKDETE